MRQQFQRDFRTKLNPAGMLTRSPVAIRPFLFKWLTKYAGMPVVVKTIVSVSFLKNKLSFLIISFSVSKAGVAKIGALFKRSMLIFKSLSMVIIFHVFL
jgi:hypothetical protein